MKIFRTLLLPCIFVAICTLCVSCGKKETVEQPNVIEEVQTAEEKSYVKKNGTMLYTGWTLYTENDEGKMIASFQAAAGDEIKIYYDGENPLEKKAIRRLNSGEEEEFNFVRVDVIDENPRVTFGQPKESPILWTRDIFVAPLTKQALVRRGTYLYSTPDVASLTKTKLSFGELVALKEAQGDFYSIITYNGTPYGKEMFIPSDMLFTNEKEIDAGLTFRRLRKEDPNSIVFSEIESIVHGYMFDSFED